MLKTVSKEVQKYTPIKERGSDKPTTACYRALSKADYDAYMNSLLEIRGTKVISKSEKASEILFKRALAADEKGVFIYNAIIDGIEIDEILDKDQAVKFLLGLEDIETANEIEQKFRGQSSLSEDEEKN